MDSGFEWRGQFKPDVSEVEHLEMEAKLQAVKFRKCQNSPFSFTIEHKYNHLTSFPGYQTLISSLYLGPTHLHSVQSQKHTN